MEKEQIEKYLELSKKIREMSNELRGLEIEKEKNEYTQGTKIRDKLNEIEHKQKEIEGKIITIIGQMYKGVLVKNCLSIREGKVYAYHCRYEPSCNSIIEDIERKLSEVEEKVGKNKIEVLNYLIQINKYLRDLKQNKDEINISAELEIEPLFFADFGYRDESIELKEIKKIVVDKSGFHFYDSKGKETGIYRKEYIIEERYLDKMKEMAKKVLTAYTQIEKDLEKYNEEISEKGAKYLIASNL